MEIYLLFLFACLLIGVAKPQMRRGRVSLLVVGLAVVVSIGYFVFRLV